ncbi:MAG: hypothetical protein HOV96_17750 [Nonomuraea sp.]|nr:hypothetical protein [Nonomuraea sp.]
MPAQAEVQYTNVAKGLPIDGLGGGTGGSPLDLLGGLLGGELLGGLSGLGGLGGLGGGDAKSAADPHAADIADEKRRAAMEMTPNAAEDVTRLGGPLPELSPILSSMSIGQGTTGLTKSGLTKSLPLLGGARMAQPSVKAAPGSKSAPVSGAMGAMSGLVESSVGGAMGTLGGGMLLPGGAGARDAATTAMNGPTKGLHDLSAGTAMEGLTRAARLALPHASSGELSPMVGHVAPVEAAPVIEALPGATQAASVDEVAPLMKDTAGFVAANGSKAAGSYSDVMSALGWTTDALTSSVRDSWVRD